MIIRLAVGRTALDPYTFPSRDPFISRGIETIDSSCKLISGIGDDNDARFVFTSASRLLYPDYFQSTIGELQPNEKQRSIESPDDNPSP
jgi:hypothetical protein